MLATIGNVLFGTSEDNMKSTSSIVGSSAIVTGGSGFVGQRLCEMLLERGAKRVVSFDISPKPKDALESAQIEYVKGDLTNFDDINKAAVGCTVVYHIAALVGPFHPKEAYRKVNYEGTLNVLKACKEQGIKRFVMSSSPSTRFPYPDPNVEGLTEDQLFEKNGGDFAPVFLAPYAETKAMGEKAVREACGTKENDLLTVAVAPHQVYGPRDVLTLPSFLEAAGSGKLRIFGDGEIRISWCYVDNYCHGLMLGADALYPGSPALGKYYVVTDDTPQYFWKVLDQAVMGMGFASLFSKAKIPTWLIMSLAYLVMFVGNIFSAVSGVPQHVVSYHMKLNPFTAKMLTINRYFDISNAKRDLHYVPLITFEDGWAKTIKWMRENWLPKYLEKKNAKKGSTTEKKSE